MQNARSFVMCKRNERAIQNCIGGVCYRSNSTKIHCVFTVRTANPLEGPSPYSHLNKKEESQNHATFRKTTLSKDIFNQKKSRPNLWVNFVHIFMRVLERPCQAVACSHPQDLEILGCTPTPWLSASTRSKYSTNCHSKPSTRFLQGLS